MPPRSLARLSWLLPLLATLVAAWGGWLLGGGQLLDVGASSDAPYVRGFYDREQVDGATYRWSRSDAEVLLPVSRAPAELVVRMAGRPGGVPLALDVDGLRLPAFDVRPLEVRRYRVLLPPAPHGGDLLTIVLGAEARRTEADSRQLAVLVESVALQPMAGVPDAPPLSTTLSLAGVALAAWAALRLAGARILAATGAATLIGVSLSLLWAVQRLFVGPYLPATATGALLLALLLGGLRLAGRGATRDAALLAGCLTAAAGLAWLAGALLTGALGWPAFAGALLLALGLGVVGLRGRAMAVAGGLALLGAGLAALGAGAALVAVSPRGAGFHALYRAASRLWYATLPLYNTTALDANPLGGTYAAPPALATLALPFVSLPYEPALLAWRVTSLALVAAAAALLLRAYGLPLRSWPAAGLGLLLLTFTPLWEALAVGQLSPLLLLLLAASLLLLQRSRPLAHGVLLGIAAALSPTLLLLLGHLVVRRSWRGLLGAVAAIVGVTAASLAVAGVPAHAVYLQAVAETTLVSTGWAQNQSLHGFVYRLLVPDQLDLRPATAPMARTIALLLALVVLVATCWLTRRGGLRPDLGFGLWVVALVLCAPVAAAHDQLLLALPLFQGFALARQATAGGGREPGGLSWPAAACYTLAFLLIVGGFSGAWYDGVPRGAFWQLALSGPLYGALLLYAGIILGARSLDVAAGEHGHQFRGTIPAQEKEGDLQLQRNHAP